MRRVPCAVWGCGVCRVLCEGEAHLVVLVLDDVPLVDHDDARAAALHNERRQPLLLRNERTNEGATLGNGRGLDG